MLERIDMEAGHSGIHTDPLFLLEGGHVLGRSTAGLGWGALGLVGFAGLEDVRIQRLHDSQVLERVGLESLLLGAARAGSAQDGLDFSGVDDATQVRVGDSGHGQRVVALEGGLLGEGTVQGIQGLESTLGPDAEATQVTTGSQQEQVQCRDRNHLNTGNVAEGLGAGSGQVLVDDQGATALAVAAVAHLTLTGAESLGFLDTFNVGNGSNLFQNLNSSASLVDLFHA